MPDAADFLQEFPTVMEQLWKYGQRSTVLAVRQGVHDASAVDLGV